MAGLLADWLVGWLAGLAVFPEARISLMSIMGGKHFVQDICLEPFHCHFESPASGLLDNLPFGLQAHRPWLLLAPGAF